MSRTFSKRLDPDMMFSRTMRERLNLESEVQSDFGTSTCLWYAVIRRPSGHIVIERNYDPGDTLEMLTPLDPPSHQQIYAEQAAIMLNKECAHDGAWIVALTHAPEFADLLRVNPNYEWRRMVKLWMDADGDVQFAVDNIEPFSVIMQVSLEHFIEQTEEAWKQWKQLMRDAVDPQTHQLKPLALMKERGTA